MAANQNSFHLPEQCYTVLDQTGELILLKRGESGYYATEQSKRKREENRILATQFNSRLGVSPQEEQAMLFGARFSWDHPAADPDFYYVSEPHEPFGPGDEQRAYSINGGAYYLSIQTCEDGYDYTIFHRNFRGHDGGQLDEPNISMDQAVQEILEMFQLQNLPRTECDMDELAEKTEEVDLVRFQGDYGAFSLNARIDQARERAEQQGRSEPETAKEDRQF